MPVRSPILLRNLGALGGAIAAPVAGFIMLLLRPNPDPSSMDITLAQTGILCLGLMFGAMVGAVGGLFGGLLGDKLIRTTNAAPITACTSGALFGALMGIWIYYRC